MKKNKPKNPKGIVTHLSHDNFDIKLSGSFSDWKNFHDHYFFSGKSKKTKTLRYSHLSPAHKVKAVDILDGKLTGGLSTSKATIQKLDSPIKKEVAVNG